MRVRTAIEPGRLLLQLACWLCMVWPQAAVGYWPTSAAWHVESERRAPPLAMERGPATLPTPMLWTPLCSVSLQQEPAPSFDPVYAGEGTTVTWTADAASDELSPWALALLGDLPAASELVEAVAGWPGGEAFPDLWVEWDHEPEGGLTPPGLAACGYRLDGAEDEHPVPPPGGPLFPWSPPAETSADDPEAANAETDKAEAAEAEELPAPQKAAGDKAADGESESKPDGAADGEAVAAGQPEKGDTKEGEEPPAVAAVKPKEPPKLWTVRLEFGMNGAEGNSRMLTTRSAVKAKRKTDHDELTLDTRHDWSRNKSKRTVNDYTFEGRYEELFPDTPWSLYVHNLDEVDEFTVYDYRVTVDGGVGYQFIDAADTKLRGRLGVGTSREFGPPDAQYIPEGTVSFNFEHKFAARFKLTAKSDLYAELTDNYQFRATSECAWEMKLDETGKLNLKMSVNDRYDSTAQGRRNHDTRYVTQITWDF